MGHNASRPDSIVRELRAWHTTGLRIAIWGAGAEAAAFLQVHGVDAHRFPIVVDSDPGNSGRYMPGTGQIVHSPAWLLENPIDIILVPSPKQAPRIVREIEAAHIPYEGILVPADGRLVDFHAASDLYPRTELTPA